MFTFFVGWLARAVSLPHLMSFFLSQPAPCMTSFFIYIRNSQHLSIQTLPWSPQGGMAQIEIIQFVTCHQRWLKQAGWYICGAKSLMFLQTNFANVL